jgi:hypothetical protein
MMLLMAACYQASKSKISRGCERERELTHAASKRKYSKRVCVFAATRLLLKNLLLQELTTAFTLSRPTELFEKLLGEKRQFEKDVLSAIQ